MSNQFPRNFGGRRDGPPEEQELFRLLTCGFPFQRLANGHRGRGPTWFCSGFACLSRGFLRDAREEVGFGLQDGGLIGRRQVKQFPAAEFAHRLLKA